MSKPIDKEKTFEEVLEFLGNHKENENVLNMTDPLDIILAVAEHLNWQVALPEADTEGTVAGIVLGSPEFIEYSLVEPETFEIWEKQDND